MIDFAPGIRTIIRDEEWMVKKIETNSLGNKTLYCVGVSPLVKDREAIFLTDLEKIQIVDPAEVKLVADASPFYKRALLYLESQWRQQIPTDANLHIGHKAAMDLMPYQLDPAKLALQRPRQRIQQYGTEPEYPWHDWNAVLRHNDNNKWYSKKIREMLLQPG